MKKFFAGLLITILCIVVIVVVAAVVVVNLTPRQLKLEDLSLGNMTIEELGIADTKILEIIKSITNIGKVEEDDVVNRPFDSTAEKEKAEGNLDNSSVSEGSLSDILKDKVVYDKRYLLTYQDTTIAYMLDSAIHDAENPSEAIAVLQDAHISVKEIAITKKDSNGAIRIVAEINLGDFKAQIEDKLGAAKSFLTVPGKVFLVSELDFTVDSNGKMQTTSKSLSINGNNEDPVSKAIIQVVLSNMEEGMTLEKLNGYMGSALSEIIYNLGAIGEATVTEGNVVEGEPTLGIGGIKENAISVITHVSA